MDVIKSMNTQDRFMYFTIGVAAVVMCLQVWSIWP